MVPKQAVMNDKNWDEINQPQRAIGSWLRWRWQWRAEVTAGRLDHVLWEMPAKDTGFGNSVLLLLGRPFAFPGRQGAGPRRNYPFLPSQPLGFPQAFDSSFFPLKSPVCLEAPCTWPTSSVPNCCWRISLPGFELISCQFNSEKESFEVKILDLHVARGDVSFAWAFLLILLSDSVQLDIKKNSNRYSLSSIMLRIVEISPFILTSVKYTD